LIYLYTVGVLSIDEGVFTEPRQGRLTTFWLGRHSFKTVECLLLLM